MTHDELVARVRDLDERVAALENIHPKVISERYDMSEHPIECLCDTCVRRRERRWVVSGGDIKKFWEGDGWRRG